MRALAQLKLMIVSKNRLEGSLSDVKLDELLAACHKHMVTGAIKVWDAGGRHGVLILRAGFVDQARFGDFVGDPAIEEMKKLIDGTYELAQQLPDLTGSMGTGSSLEGSAETVSLVSIMRHCEENALSCTVTVINEFDRGEIHYKAGDLQKVTLNGKDDDDAITAMIGWKTAKYRVAAPPLDKDLPGWPTVGRESTQPFKVDDALKPPEMKAAAERHEKKQEKLEKPPEKAEAGKPAAEAGKAPAEAGKPASKPAEAAKASKPAEAAKPAAKPLVAKPLETPRSEDGPGLGRLMAQSFLLTLVAVLALTLLVLLASR